MPAAGLEPARGCPQQILSLPRLPFRHAGLLNTSDIIREIFEFVNKIMNFFIVCRRGIPRAKGTWYNNFIHAKEEKDND